MSQAQDTTPHPVTVYRHWADLSLCYPLVWNVTLEYIATHFNVLGETRPGNPSPTFHTQQQKLNLMLSWWSTVGSSVESTVPTGSWTRDLWCANRVRYPLAHSKFRPKLLSIHLSYKIMAYRKLNNITDTKQMTFSNTLTLDLNWGTNINIAKLPWHFFSKWGCLREI